MSLQMSLDYMWEERKGKKHLLLFLFINCDSLRKIHLVCFWMSSTSRGAWNRAGLEYRPGKYINKFSSVVVSQWHLCCALPHLLQLSCATVMLSCHPSLFGIKKDELQCIPPEIQTSLHSHIHIQGKTLVRRQGLHKGSWLLTIKSQISLQPCTFRQ